MTDTLRPLVHVVDDDEAVRDSIRLLLYSVGLAVETYASAADFLARAELTRPGCVVADVRMPGMSGLDLQKTLAGRKVPLPVIILTGHGDIPMAVGALRAGASDFIEKPYDDQHLIDSVHRALDQGDRDRRDRERIDWARACWDKLTAREKDVMTMVAAGDSNKVIGARLGISPRTVEVHRGNVMEKFEVRTLSDLVRAAQLLEET
jgi:two-component system response regulator FixJ